MEPGSSGRYGERRGSEIPLAIFRGAGEYFFSMATSFTKAALGAEGVGADVTMIVGKGYTKGHAEITLQELRENAELRKIFEELYA